MAWAPALILRQVAVLETWNHWSFQLGAPRNSAMWKQKNARVEIETSMLAIIHSSELLSKCWESVSQLPPRGIPVDSYEDSIQRYPKNNMKRWGGKHCVAELSMQRTSFYQPSTPRVYASTWHSKLCALLDSIGQSMLSKQLLILWVSLSDPMLAHNGKAFGASSAFDDLPVLPQIAKSDLTDSWNYSESDILKLAVDCRPPFHATVYIYTHIYIMYIYIMYLDVFRFNIMLFSYQQVTQQLPSIPYVCYVCVCINPKKK